MLRFCAANVIEGKAIRRIEYGTTEVMPGKELLKTSFQVCAPFSIYRKSFLDKAGLRFHPGILHEDNEFTPRAYYKASRVGSCNDIIYLDEEMLEDEGIDCPNCGTHLEFDFDCDCDCDDCDDCEDAE